MIISFSIYQYVIYMVVFILAGALVGITYSWYRINYKPIRGAHRERRTSNPTYRDAYTKGWEDGVYKRISSIYPEQTDNSVTISQPFVDYFGDFEKSDASSFYEDEPVEPRGEGRDSTG